MGKSVGRRRVNGGGRSENKYTRQPYDYQFKLKVIDYYATVGISATIARFFSSTEDGPKGSKRKLVNKWKQQRARIEQRAGTSATSSYQRSRDRGLATTLLQAAETSIVKWVNDFRRGGVPISSAMLRIRALDEAEQLKIPLGVFSATWRWQSGFMKRHRFSFRVKTHTGQTAPLDALEQATIFAHEVARRADVEGIKTIYNADQTAVFFELLPRTTITKTGSKTVWVKCGKKEKERMTAMVLGDSQGSKYPLFLVMKTAPSKIVAIEAENKRVRHGFGQRLWNEIEPLQDELDIQVHGNQSAWWTGALTVESLRFHFGQRSVSSDLVMLLLDDFSDHWIKEATVYARSLNVVLAKVPLGLTWLCQPTDAVWIKPIKDHLRRHWLLHLQDQIADHRIRPRAATFVMKAPDRSKVARWASDAWKDIPASMIVAGFAHCKFGVEAAAIVEPAESIEMQMQFDEVVRDLEELSVVDTCEIALDDDQNVVDQSAHIVVGG